MQYIKLNNLVGLFCFGIALTTYVLTLDQSVSFWDCGEFIASAFRLEVEHQPGAPLVSMMQKIFSTFSFGNRTKTAYFINLLSACASAGTILFLFWTITALAKKNILEKGKKLTTSQIFSILSAGLVGALAYAFSDSFWFSAVEAEVYAMSSFFTALVIWAILKWEARAAEPGSDRWLLFIAYIIGLSIGIHLLNLLCIPAVVMLYYFKKNQNPQWPGIFKAFCIGICILAFVQFGIIQLLLSIAANFDYFFVNTLKLGFGSGIAFFSISVIAILTYIIKYSIVKNKRILNLCTLSVVLIIFGYSSFATLIIRAHAKPNLNNYNVDNIYSFLRYVGRDQYGERPLLYGQNYNSEKIDIKTTGELFRKGNQKYESAGTKSDYIYEEKTLLPRMYSDKPDHIRFYKSWMNFDEQHKPTLIDNFNYMMSFQIGQMYLRYFMWNFVGRQDNQDGQHGGRDGGWISGIKPIDSLRLGNQNNLPPSITENKAYNRFFFLPLILGILGALWHFLRNRKDAGIVALLFIFSGVAIVIYLNSVPVEPRERDYAYVGSFYAFTIWIGLGVLAIKDWFFKKLRPIAASSIAAVLALSAGPLLMATQGWDDHDRSKTHLAHDISVNYLKSCAPNAILFTYGDNDTYPVWYAQEVENVRPDVRVVNLSLFTADWYIDGLRKKQNDSAPLPISMKPEQYVEGTRDVMYYQDYKIAQHIELHQILEVLLSENNEDKVTMNDGSKYNILPTKNLKLTVNQKEVLDTGTVPKEDAGKIADKMEWTYGSNYLTKGTLALFDILVNNHWKRPIYFTGAMPAEQYVGLEKYLYTEGLTLRLLPLTPDITVKQNMDRINIEPMYNNLMHIYQWGNIKNASHLDRQSADNISLFSGLFNGMIEKLINNGKLAEAKMAADKYFDVLPLKFYSMRQLGNTYYFTESLYRLNDTSRANMLVVKSADYLNKELNYLADISISKSRLTSEAQIQFYMAYFAQMIKLTEANQQKTLSKKMEEQYSVLLERFSPFITG